MSEHEAVRTLVKSPPELWEVCSDAEALGRHLQGFGEIRITRMEPESTVAWEGERVSGTVQLEPSGWGTKVTLTAIEPDPPAAPAPPVPPEPPAPPVSVKVVEPPVVEEPPAVVNTPRPVAQPSSPGPRPRRRGLLGRLMALFEAPPPARPEPAPAVTEAPPRPEPVPATEPPFVPKRPALLREPPAPSPPEPAESETSAALDAALESLGQAHHRPFSRS